MQSNLPGPAAPHAPGHPVRVPVRSLRQPDAAGAGALLLEPVGLCSPGSAVCLRDGQRTQQLGCSQSCQDLMPLAHLGTLCGSQYAASGSLTWPVLAHCCWNLWAFARLALLSA